MTDIDDAIRANDKMIAIEREREFVSSRAKEGRELRLTTDAAAKGAKWRCDAPTAAAEQCSGCPPSRGRAFL